MVNPRGTSSQTGFTLIELVAVLVIMALASALVIPSVRSGNEQREVRRTVQRFVSAVRAGSSRAIRERKLVGLVLDVEKPSFGVRGDDRVIELPSSGAFGEIRGGYVEGDGQRFVFEFYPTGGSTGGSVELVFELRAGRQTYVMNINPLLSTVGIEEGM